MSEKYESAVAQILEMIGEDAGRDGLKDTPRRVVKAYKELTSGYGKDVAEVLGVKFDVPCDEMIVVDKIPFVSLCEHHMLPFTGFVKIGYIPGGSGGVVGLSKLARLTDIFARRLQVQERLTQQIGDAIQKHLDPLGCGVIVEATHSCMSMRGVNKAAVMVTSSLRGVFRDDPTVRAEFLDLKSR